jgi:hypothetical protein
LRPVDKTVQIAQSLVQAEAASQNDALRVIQNRIEVPAKNDAALRFVWISEK